MCGSEVGDGVSATEGDGLDVVDVYALAWCEWLAA
jgi:hypothetical protein